MVVLVCGILISGTCLFKYLEGGFVLTLMVDRLGGAAGTNLQDGQCPKSGAGGTTNCFAAFLALHLTPQSTAYLEVYIRLFVDENSHT